MTGKVVIKEVAARDGLQAQPKHLSVAQRLELLAALGKTGVPELEIGSFVSPQGDPADGRDRRDCGESSRDNSGL